MYGAWKTVWLLIFLAICSGEGDDSPSAWDVIIERLYKDDVREILPWNSSLILSTEPLTWRVNETGELTELLDLDDYQQHQWSSIYATPPSTLDRGNWTICSPCIDSNRLLNSFQLRYQTDSVSQVEYIEARICTPPKCPAVRHRGYWKYDWLLDNYMTKIFQLDSDVKDIVTEVNPQHQQLPFYIRECAMSVYQHNLKFAVLSRNFCYGSNSSEILKRGSITNVDNEEDDWMQVLIYQECPVSCKLVGAQRLCLCSHSEVDLPLSDAVLDCETSSSIIYPLSQVEIIQQAIGNFTGLDEEAMWVVSDIGETLNYSCVYLNNSSVPCNTSTEHKSICLYKDPNQYDWLEPVSLTCTKACGTGSLTSTHYRLLPPVDMEVGYSPQYKINFSSCNADPCPWVSENTTFSRLYPKWDGCWKEDDLTPVLYKNSSVLDGDQLTRLEFVEKCAAATYNLSNSFAVNRRLCYIFNVTEPTLYSTPSQQCASFSQILGEGFDIFTYSTEPLPGRWGVWIPENNCTHACGGGTQLSHRWCNNPPNSEDSELTHCVGSSTGYHECNSEKCPAQQFGYKSVDCYDISDLKLKKHADSLLDGHIPHGRQDAIRKCAVVAHQGGYTLFGLAYGGHCIKIDNDMKCKLLATPLSDKCDRQLGADSAMSVFSFSSKSLSPQGCSSPSTDPVGPSPSSTVPTVTNGSNSDSMKHQIENLIRQQVVNAEEAGEALNQLGSDISSITELTEESVAEVAQIFSLISDKLSFDENINGSVFADSIVGTLDALTQQKYASVWKETGSFTLVLSSVETMIIKLSGATNQSVEKDTQQTYLAAKPLLRSEFISDDYTLDVASKNVVISLPSKVIQSGVGGTVPLAVTVFSNGGGFIGDSAFDGELSSDGAKTNFANVILMLKLGENESHTGLAEDIKLHIPVDLAEERAKYGEDKQVEPVCVFWNVSSKLWSSEGCKTKQPDAGSEVTCSCDHMTSFAVLLRVTDYEPKPKISSALTIISYIGCAISLLALILSFATFVYLDNLKTERKKIHMNLIVALGLAQLTHVVGIDLTYDPITCKCMAVLLHLLYLSTFTWMLCEGIHLYHKVIAVFEQEGIYKRVFYYIIGWGVPVLIVAVSVGIKYESYGSDKFCWLSVTDGLIAAFVGPVCVVILVNFIIMAIVIRVVVKSTCSVAPQEDKKVQSVKAGVKSVLILTPILGINWVFGLLAVNKDLLVFEFLFVIVNSLQGLMIFLFHCVGSSEVRYAFARKREQASRSLDRSTEYKDSKMAAWPTRLFHLATQSKSSKSKKSSEDTSNNDLVDGVISGRMGRNVGGLKHMVKEPEPSGMINHAFLGSTRTAFSPTSDCYLDDDGDEDDRTSRSARFSTSTVSTNLSEDSHRYSTPMSCLSTRHSKQSMSRRNSSQTPSENNRATHPLAIGLGDAGPLLHAPTVLKEDETDAKAIKEFEDPRILNDRKFNGISSCGIKHIDS